MADKVLDSWRECASCGAVYPQDNTPKPKCVCGSYTFLYKYTALNDLHDSVGKDKELQDYREYAARKIVPERAAKAGRRKKYFEIPKGMI